MTHFPPAVPCQAPLRLLDDHLVLDAAQRNNASIILSGHLHQNIEHSGGGVHIFCAGSMTSCEEDGNHWIHLIEVDVQGEQVVSCIKTDFHWDDSEAGHPIVAVFPTRRKGKAST